MSLLQDRMDEEAAQDEGLTPVLCPHCRAELARQTADGNRLVLNGQTGSYHRAKLSCKCGKGLTWRPSRGNKSKSRLDSF
jgi:hypothetical protein